MAPCRLTFYCNFISIIETKIFRSRSFNTPPTFLWMLLVFTFTGLRNFCLLILSLLALRLKIKMQQTIKILVRPSRATKTIRLKQFDVEKFQLRNSLTVKADWIVGGWTGTGFGIFRKFRKNVGVEFKSSPSIVITIIISSSPLIPGHSHLNSNFIQPVQESFFLFLCLSSSCFVNFYQVFNPPSPFKSHDYHPPRCCATCQTKFAASDLNSWRKSRIFGATTTIALDFNFFPQTFRKVFFFGGSLWMASSRNGSKSTGLRILWIPGKKRHDRKGIYSSTTKVMIKVDQISGWLDDLISGSQQELLAAEKQSGLGTAWAEKAN